MKLRHARALAACVLVVITATGARGCGGSSHSGSRSSDKGGGFTSGGNGGGTSSGMSNGGLSNGGRSDGGLTSGGSRGSSGSTYTPDGRNNRPASPTPEPGVTEGKQDFMLTRCQIRRDSESEGNVIFSYSITNGNARRDADYNGTVQFVRKSDEKVLGSTSYSVRDLAPGKTESGRVKTTVTSYDNDMKTLVGKCTIRSVYKTNAF